MDTHCVETSVAARDESGPPGHTLLVAAVTMQVMFNAFKDLQPDLSMFHRALNARRHGECQIFRTAF